MAKNRSMAIKHDKAKKCAMEEVMLNAKNEMCCKNIPKNYHIYGDFYNKSRDEVFYSKCAIQKRVNTLMGRPYPVDKFREKWHDIYVYLVTHTIPETRQYFGITYLSC